jgi:hypothetical protein
MLVGVSLTKKSSTSKGKTHQIRKGIRAFIDDSLYTFDTEYTLLATHIFDDKRDTLYSVEIAGIRAIDPNNYITWTSKIRVSVGFKHHDVTPGTYFHDYFRNDDTLCGITYSNKCYDYYMPNRLNPNYNVTIISIDSTSVQGTFVGQVDALWYDNPHDSTTLCKESFRPKEKFMIRGEFNVPVQKEIILQKK